MHAKRFLIERIAGEARRQNAPLSDLEEKMLYFSESYPTLPGMVEISERFDREADTERYEEKMRRLGRSAREHASEESAAMAEKWNDALAILAKEDHYILVMLDRSLPKVQDAGNNNKDQWRLLGYGLLAAILMGLVLGPIIVYVPDFPRWGAELILAGIGIGVYFLSKRMESRPK